MKEYAKIIDKMTIEMMSFTYKDIKDIGVDEEKYKREGFYPLAIKGKKEDFENPSLVYTLENDYVVGTYCEKETALQALRDSLLSEVDKAFEDAKGRVTHHPEEKDFIENRLAVLKQRKIAELNNAKSYDEIKAVNICEVPASFYKIKKIYQDLITEKDLDDNTGFENDFVNILAYFHNSTQVYYGDMGIKNEEYLEEHGINCMKLSYGSGNIVALKGDLDLSVNSPNEETGLEIMKIVCEILREKGLNAYIDNNDMMIDGKKFSGCVRCTKLEGEDMPWKFYSHISFNLDRELIEKIRVKPTDKDIISINEVLPGFTAEELLDLIKLKLDDLGYKNI